MRIADSEYENNLPMCVVLLATYNGDRWLEEQLTSIFNQTGVHVSVRVSDDNSTDQTMNIISRWMKSSNLSLLPQSNFRFKSANKNFIRLICDSDIGNADYVALADQDDIWHIDKLSRAIDVININSAAAYSSNVEAFWPDGKRKIIKKSHALKDYDYLFESPGPGCTFVFSRSFFLEIQKWARNNSTLLSELWVHDWSLYAYARSLKLSWVIDNFVSLRYRQHSSNEIGANLGFRAISSRLDHVRSGRYRRNVLLIFKLVGAPERLQRALQQLTFKDRLWLIINAHHFRRSIKDVLAISLLFILMK